MSFVPRYFVSYATLVRDIAEFARLVPPDVVGIVGIPRSGLMVASMLGLHMHLPVASATEFFVSGRFLPGGKRLHRARESDNDDVRAGQVLLVDDSAWSGRSMGMATAAAEFLGWDRERLVRGALYASTASLRGLDAYLRVHEEHRLFEWNLWQHEVMHKTMTDLDGVLCEDPVTFDDDGPQYEAALALAAPRYRPRYVRSIVTNRLERWRSVTVSWLMRHGVKYHELIMRPEATAAERRAAGDYGEWKAARMLEADVPLFVESSSAQAEVIHRVTGRAIVDVAAMRLLCAE